MAGVAGTSNKLLAMAHDEAQKRTAYSAQDHRILATRLSRIVDAYPHLNAGTAMALAEAGYDHNSVEVRTVGELQAKKDSEGGWLGKFKQRFTQSVNVVKPGVRVGLAAAAAPYETIQGGVRERLHEIKTGEGVPGYHSLGDVLGTSAITDAASGRNTSVNQSRLGAAAQVSREAPGVSVAEALNDTPQIGPDGDVTALLERNQQSWFPGPNSLAEKRQVANARAADTTDGRATTFGRLAGHLVGFQPGGVAHRIMGSAIRLADSPYLGDSDKETERLIGQAQRIFEGSIDAGSALAFDPVGKGGAIRGATAAERGLFKGPAATVLLKDTVQATAKVTDKATRQVTEVPILVDNGTRPTVVFKSAHDWLMTSKKGDRFARYAAAETSYNRLAAVMGRDTPPATILRILDERDPTAMKRLLLDEMGKGFVTREADPLAADMAAAGLEAPRIASFASATVRRPTARWRQLAPSETVVSRSDPAWAVEQYRRQAFAMRTGALKEHLTPEYLDKNVEAFARGLTDETGDWSEPHKALADLAYTTLLAHGVDKGHAEQITRIWQQRVTGERNYWIDRLSGRVRSAWATMNGRDEPIASAASSAEMLTDGIPLLDATEIKRAAARLNKLYMHPGWEGAVAVGDGITAFFKFMVLPVRGPAWMIRNLAEAQARITVYGYSGMLNSPLDALAYRVGDNPNSAVSRMIGRQERSTGRGSVDAAGDDIRLRAELEPGVAKFARVQEHKGGPWHDTAVMYSDDYPVVRKGVDNYNIWLAGNRFTISKLAASPEYRMAVDAQSPEHAANMFWKSKTRLQMAHQRPELLTREGADAYMTKVAERIQEVTNGNPSLREAISTGRIDGVPIISRNAAGNLTANPKADRALAAHEHDLPEFTVSDGGKRMRGSQGQLVKAAEVADRLLFTKAFALFGSVPNNRFVNSPLFREIHWREAERLAPLATKEAKQQLVANARKARMPKDVIRRLEADTGPAGQLDVEDIRDLADTRAFTVWMDIVYNSHNKGNWTRSVRMISPFAAAVADMYRFWGKALYRNPLILHRVEQGMHGARQSGFFFTDDNGEERFAYPGTRALMSMASGGVDRGLSGTVKGANMITSSVLPGAGPVVSWPAGLFLPDQKATDEIRGIINPYGDPDASGGLLEGFAPSHVQRILAAAGFGSPEQRRRYQESTADVMAYLASTGNYGTSADEQARMRDDAEHKGRIMYLLQAFTQAGVPASPRAEQYFKDLSGRAIKMSLVAADYRRLMREDPDTATQELLKMYGDAVFDAVVGGTKGTAQFATQESHDLARAHPEVVDRYADVWSFFTDPNSPYSHDEFRRQLGTQERTTRTLKERQVSAQSSLANSMYMGYKRQFGPFPTPEEAAYLRTVKAKIQQKFPLWDQSFDVAAAKEKVAQAFAAAKDPVFRDSDVAGAVRAYEKARASVRDWSNESGITSSESGWGRAKNAEQGRDYLRQVAASLIEQVPGFETMWDRVFDGEMVDDVEGAP